MKISALNFLAVVIVSFSAFSVPAEAQLRYDEIAPKQSSGAVVDISAQSAIVLNQVTGEVLYTYNETVSRVPASVTKLVTVLVAFDLGLPDTKRCTLTTADEVGGVRVPYKPNTSFTVKNLLYASLVPSANNATNALARCTGVSSTEFVTRMNEKAKALGAVNTVFVDPSGISPQNTTTASDLAKIANAAFSTERLRTIVSNKSFRFCSVAPRVACMNMYTTNALLSDSSVKVLAGKTGYLDEAGYNFAGSFRDSKGNYYIVVVLGSNTKESRFTDAKKLLQSVSK